MKQSEAKAKAESLTGKPVKMIHNKRRYPGKVGILIHGTDKTDFVGYTWDDALAKLEKSIKPKTKKKAKKVKPEPTLVSES